MKLIVNIIVAILLCSPQIASAVCVQGDCINGHGTDVLPDKSKYEGEFQNGMRNGQGEATYPDGSRYIGQWANDLPNGQGIKILTDKTQYSGNFKNGIMYGSGMIIMPDGSKTKIKWQTDNREIAPQRIDLSGEPSEQTSPQASKKEEVAVQKQIQTETANKIQLEGDTEGESEAVMHAREEDSAKPDVPIPQNLKITTTVEYASIAVGANIRSGASMTAEVLHTVPPGYPVVVLEKKADWLLVDDFLGRKGWVYASLATKPGTVIIKVLKGNLRSGPSLKDDIIAKLNHGTIMSVLERSGEWLKVSDLKELKGWLHFTVIWPSL